jgi:hypothetical protein
VDVPPILNGQAKVTVRCPVTLIVGNVFFGGRPPAIPVNAVAIMNLE